MTTKPDSAGGLASALGPRLRGLSLTQRFLIVSVIVIAAAMALLGAGVSYYVRNGIADGIAETAAASIDSLVTHSLDGMFISDTLTDADRSRLDRLFEIGSAAEPHQVACHYAEEVTLAEWHRRAGELAAKVGA